VTLLTPVYNEEDNLHLYEQTIGEILFSRTEYDFGVLFIDDGSTDRSWDIIKEICARDSRFRGIRLSRNYGSHLAISAGFANEDRDSDAVVIMACDLQDPPEVILEFIKKWESGAKIVWGQRRLHEDKGMNRLANTIFYMLMHRFGSPKGTHFNTGSFFLVDRVVAECYRQFAEQNRIISALVALTGFEQDVVIYSRRPRVAGISGWTFSKKSKALYDALLGYSFMPIKLMPLFGIGVFLFAVILAVYSLYCWFTSNPVEGYTSLMLAMSFFFGIQFLLMSIIGEYLYRIYTEVVRRPLYFISDRTNPSKTKV
jgi:dolichol-phosphate mannosyltransferase